MSTESIPARAYSILDRLTAIAGLNDCWPFSSTAKLPRIWVCNRAYYPRRLAYQRAYGPVPLGFHVQDTCGDRKCCNPQHLYAARPRETIDLNLSSRFFEKVDKTEGCWNWVGATTPDGYGILRYAGKQHRAHRVAWFLETRAWPPVEPSNIMLCHSCNNPSCVRVDPEHVYLGTGLTNAQDRELAGTVPRGETHGSRTKPESVKKGEKNGRAELSTAEVQTIRATANFYRGQRGLIPALARYYQMDPTTIGDIINRLLWRDLPDDPLAEPLPPAAVSRVPVDGENSAACKLSDRQVREIRYLYHQAGGRHGSLSRLSRRYPLRTSQLQRIAKRQTRTEVPDEFDKLPPLEPLFPA